LPPDLADVRGQMHAKRALTIAAAGAHSSADDRAAGTGKSMLAQRLARHPAAAHRGRGARERVDRLARRALFSVDVGRASVPRAASHGERRCAGRRRKRSAAGRDFLAHHGVLFLDELPEWDRRVLEVLREPLESGVIHISRAARQSTFPAEFQFVSAMNPVSLRLARSCERTLSLLAGQDRALPGRVSGPLLDRIDLGVEVPRARLRSDRARGDRWRRCRGRRRHERARARRSDRGTQPTTRAQGKPNARLARAEIEANCRPDRRGCRATAHAMARLVALGARVSPDPESRRTIADLAGAARSPPRMSRKRSRIGRFDRM
jgi:magnesium chelatase family protein